MSNNLQDLCAVKTVLIDILGLTLEPLAEKEVQIAQEIQKLIDDRVQTRLDKNWALADQIRDKLAALDV